MWPQEILKKRAVVYSFDFSLGWNEAGNSYYLSSWSENSF